MNDKQRADMLTEHCRNTVRILSQTIDNGLENESIASIKEFLETLRYQFIILVGNPDAPEPKGVIQAKTMPAKSSTPWLEES